MSRHLDAGLELLDRQVVDVDGLVVGKVDDLLFAGGSDGGPRLVALLLGHQALGRRLGGRVGRWWSATAMRLSNSAEGLSVPIEHVVEIGVSVRLDLPLAELPDATRGERWLRDALIGRLPGAGRASG